MHTTGSNGDAPILHKGNIILIHPASIWNSGVSLNVQIMTSTSLAKSMTVPVIVVVINGCLPVQAGFMKSMVVTMFGKSKEKKLEEVRKVEKAIKHARLMRARCNFYKEVKRFRPDAWERHQCVMVGGLMTKMCNGEDCIFMKILKKLEGNDVQT